MNTRHFSIKTRDPDKIATGANTELYMDGQKMEGVKSFKFEVSAKGVATVTVELYGSVEIDGKFVHQVGDMTPVVNSAS